MPQPPSWESTDSSSHRPLWVKRTVVAPSLSSNSISISWCVRPGSSSQIQVNASRLGYAQIPEPAIRAGVRELAEAVRAATGRG